MGKLTERAALNELVNDLLNIEIDSDSNSMALSIAYAQGMAAAYKHVFELGTHEHD